MPYERSALAKRLSRERLGKAARAAHNHTVPEKEGRHPARAMCSGTLVRLRELCFGREFRSVGNPCAVPEVKKPQAKVGPQYRCTVGCHNSRKSVK